jgi:hypothetical protein
MNVLKDFHNQIVALVALLILVVGFVLAPQERLDKVGHALVTFGSTSYGAAIYSAAGTFVVAAFRWALARIPGGASTTTPQKIVALLVLCLGASVVSACGAQLTDSQRAALAIETQRCIVNERAIVDRAGSTEAQDRADLSAERMRCDATRAAIVDGGVP